LRLSQAGQANLRQVARVPPQKCQVRDDAQRGQVSVPPCFAHTAGPLVERLCQFVGNTHTGEVEKGRGGASCRQQLRVDDGRGIRQAIREVVMVGNDDIHALRAGEGNRVICRNPGVTGNDQPGPAGDYLFQHRQGDAMTFGFPKGDVIGHATAQFAQDRDKKGCRSLPIYIEVTPHTDRFACLERAVDACDGSRHAWERVGR